MIDVDGVIGRLMELMQDAHLTPGLCSCREYRLPEVVLCNDLGAAESKENPPRFDLLKSLDI